MQSSWNTSLSISVSRNCLVNLYFSFLKNILGTIAHVQKKCRLRGRALPPALEAWSLNYWTPRKVLRFLFFK